ncbi:MAG: hypothetical protein WKG00_05725 [Polyangiaceae bacterium]
MAARRWSSLLARAAVSAAVLATMRVPVARAQAAPDATTALAMFNRAKELAALDKLDEACPMFEEVVRIEPRATGGRLHLADCYERTGRFASARTAYALAADAAAAANQSERVELARSKMRELAPKVPELTITVGAEAQALVGLEVKRNGVIVGNAQWGMGVPVDPGSHTVSAAAMGRKPWAVSIHLEPGQKGTLYVPGLSNEAAYAPAPLAGDRGDAPHTGAATPIWPWVVGGVGVALAGAAVVFAVDGATTTCTTDAEGRCDGAAYGQPEIDALNERRRRDVVLSCAFGGAGLVALGVAVYGIASGGDSAPTSGRAAVAARPWVGPGGAGLGLAGAF